MTENKKGAGFWALLVKGFATLAKASKLLKVIFAGATFASYAYMFTWKFALVILIAIGFHESGHVWAMKRLGMKTKGFYFLPFMGGVAIQEEGHKTHANQAFVAIMGPVWGFALAVATYIVYLVTHQPIFAAVASWMALVNLFNLLPVNPLDGGQLMRTITFSVHSSVGLVFLGFSILAGLGLALYMKIGLFVVLIVAAIFDFLGEIFQKRGRAKRIAELNAYREKWGDEEWIMNNLEALKEKPVMTHKQIALVASSYIGLVILLFTVMFKTAHIPGADLALLLLKD